MSAVASPARATPSRTHTAPFDAAATVGGDCNDGGEARDESRHTFGQSGSYDAATATFTSSAFVHVDPPDVNGVIIPAQGTEVIHCYFSTELNNVPLEHLPSGDDVLDIAINYSLPALTSSAEDPPGASSTQTQLLSRLRFVADEREVAAGASLWSECHSGYCRNNLPSGAGPHVLHLQARTEDGSRWGRGTLLFSWHNDVSASAVEYMANTEQIQADASLTMQLHSITITS